MALKENSELQKLININKDACDFYENAQEQSENPQLSTTFQNLKALHSDVVINLQNYVRSNGGKADANETLSGQASQLWANLMTTISNDVDETLVKHLEEAEDRCLHSIKSAMEKDYIRPQTKTVLNTELSKLQKSHDYMKSLKEMMKAA